MKNLNHIKFILPALLLAACGGSKSPVGDISQMRADAKAESQRGPDVPKTIPQYIPQEVKVEVPVGTINKDFFSIDVDKSNALLYFYEGTASVVKLRLTVNVPGVQLKLTPTTLPEGAVLVDVSNDKQPNTYEIRWKPNYGFIPFGEKSKTASVVLTPELVSAKTDKLANTIKGLVSSWSVGLNVFSTEEKPSAIVASGLDKQVQEGQVTPFSVTVRIPGVDGRSGSQPRITWSNDNSPQAAGTNFREMDGVRYLTTDPSRAAAEYLGDFKWKFNLLFDAKNVPVEAQKAKDGSVMQDADTTRTRFVLEVIGGGLSAPTTPITMQVAIKRLPPVTPPAPATPAVTTETAKTADDVGAPKSKPKVSPTPKATPKTQPKKAK